MKKTFLWTAVFFVAGMVCSALFSGCAGVGSPPSSVTQAEALKQLPPEKQIEVLAAVDAAANKQALAEAALAITAKSQARVDLFYISAASVLGLLAIAGVASAIWAHTSPLIPVAFAGCSFAATSLLVLSAQTWFPYVVVLLVLVGAAVLVWHFREIKGFFGRAQATDVALAEIVDAVEVFVKSPQVPTTVVDTLLATFDQLQSRPTKELVNEKQSA